MPGSVSSPAGVAAGPLSGSWNGICVYEFSCPNSHAAVPFMVVALVVALTLGEKPLAGRTTEPAQMRPEKRLFAFSILYLFALFGAVVADRWLLP